jgi:hypothetical protein
MSLRQGLFQRLPQEFRVRPQFICGHPRGRGLSTQHAKIFLGARVNGIRATWPVHRRSPLMWHLSQVKLLGSEYQTSGIYAKRAKQANKKRQSPGLVVFYELPSLPLAGSRLGCFYTSLCCEPRLLIRISLGWDIRHVYRSAPWTNSRPHPRIANQLAGCSKYKVSL